MLRMRLLTAALIGFVALPLTAAPMANAGQSVFVAGFQHGAHFHGGFRGRGFYGYRRGFHRGYRRGFHRGGGFGASRVLLGVGIGLLASEALRPRHHRQDRVIIRERVVTEEQLYRSIPAQTAQTEWQDPNEAAFANEDCRQIREYQTTVIIGGIEREAYGPACLKEDGSWVQGSLTVVPQFDN